MCKGNICNKCSVLFLSSTHHMPTVNIIAVNKTEYSSCLIILIHKQISITIPALNIVLIGYETM